MSAAPRRRWAVGPRPAPCSRTAGRAWLGLGLQGGFTSQRAAALALAPWHLAPATLAPTALAPAVLAPATHTTTTLAPWP